MPRITIAYGLEIRFGSRTSSYSHGEAGSMKQARVIVLFIFLVTIWGAGFVAVKAGLASIPPVLFAVFRFGIGAAIMLGYTVLLTDYRYPVGRRDWLAVGANGLFMFTIYPIALFLGQQYVPGSIAAVVSALIPLLTPGLTLALLPNEHLRFRDFLGVLLGFVGAVLVVHPSPSNFLGARTYGLALLVLSALMFALGGVVVKRIQAPLPSETLVAWSMGIGVIPLVAASILRGESSMFSIEWTGEAIFATMFLGVIVTGVGYFVYFELLDHLTPLEVNVSGYLMPVTAAITGWLWLDETITPVTMAGFLVIFIGFYLMKTDELKRELAKIRPADMEAVPDD